MTNFSDLPADVQQEIRLAYSILPERKAWLYEEDLVASLDEPEDDPWEDRDLYDDWQDWDEEDYCDPYLYNDPADYQYNDLLSNPAQYDEKYSEYEEMIS